MRSAILLCGLFLTATVSAEIPAPYAYWSFDGDVNDDSGSGFDGDLIGGSFGADVPAAIGAGMALELSSADSDYVDLSLFAADFAVLAEGSIAAWIKTSGSIGTIWAASHSLDASSEARLIFEAGSAAYDVREEFGGDFVDGDLRSPRGIGDGNWHHVAVTVSSEGSALLYVDGALVSSTEEPFFAAVGEIDTMSVGRNVDSDNPGGQWFFNGSIDELAIWEDVLSCDDIAALANGERPDNAKADDPDCDCASDDAIPLPVGYWAFDDDVDDASGFDRHGTLDGLGGGPVFDVDVPDAIGAGSSLVFDEFQQDHVDLSAHVGSFAGLTTGSISAWIQTVDPSIGVIFSASDSTQGSNEFRFFYEGVETLRCGVRSGGNRWMSRSTVNTNDGAWHHVVVTVSPEGNRLWVDGRPISVTYQYGNSNSTDFIASVPNLDKLSIGKNVDSSGPGQWFFTGKIDDLSVYDRALTCGQILALAEGSPVPTPSENDTTPPAAPTALAAVAEDSEVELDWADNGEVDFASYNVYRSLTSGAAYELVGEGVSQSQYLDTGLANGSTYYYVVTATDRAGNESPTSSEASATPEEGLDVTPPATPQNVTAGGLEGRVEVDWADNSEDDIAGYDVERSLTSGGPYEAVAEGLVASFYRDSAVLNGETYYYVVTAIDDAENRSARSAEVSASPTAVDLPMPFAYWPLNEGAGQIVRDLSGNDFDGFLGDSDAIEGSDPSWVASVTDANGVTRGPALQFGGDTGRDWINLSTWAGDASALSQGTIAAWMKIDGNDGVDTVMSLSHSTDPSSELRFYYERNLGIPGIRYDIRNDGTDAFPQISSFPTDVNDDNWRHVAVTVDAAGLASVYVDGFLANSGSEAGFFAAITDADRWSIGRNVDSGGSQWHYRGPMSEVVIWDEPLRAEEIFAIANGAPIPTPNAGDVTPPATPTGLTALANDSFVLLDWANNVEEDLRGYRVQRAESSGGPYELLDEVAGSGYTDETVLNGTDYYYIVTAIDRAGNESTATPEVEASPRDGLDTISPAAPLALVATGFDALVLLDWADSAEGDVVSYSVFRALATGGPYELLAET
ncbi:MAG: LamG-like jellyroll fold domain-containing protein, partial [Planctomycetota bacterium]